MADQPHRVNFFSGMLLTPADLAVEQQYQREMRYLHNRLHGFGTVSGLDVSVSRGRVRVGPGLAIDPCGREIVLTQPLSLRLDPSRPTTRWVRDVVVTWHETAQDPVPGPDGVIDHARWVERPEVALVPARRAAAEDVLLARLSRAARGAIEVDASVRRQLGPQDGGGVGGGGGTGGALVAPSGTVSPRMGP